MVSVERMGTNGWGWIRTRGEPQPSLFLSWVDFVGNGQSRTVLIKCVAEQRQDSALGRRHEEKLEENWEQWWVGIANNCIASFFLPRRGGTHSWNWKTKMKMSVNSVIGVCKERRVVLLSDSCLPPCEVLLLLWSHFIFTKILWGCRGGLICSGKGCEPLS